MARPAKTSEERSIHGRLEPPNDLARAQRAIWLRDISVLPANFFVPADTAVLRIYCDLTVEYIRAHSALVRATTTNRAECAREYRAVAAQLLTVLRGLRLLPYARLHKTTAANLTDDSAQTRTDAPSDGWRALMPRKPN